MKVYVVRHGETEANVNRVHQKLSEPLSKNGRKQAQVLAERLSDIPLDLIISSPFKRTKQTAEIIAKINKKPIEYCELFKEFKRPSEIEGHSRDEEEVVTIRQKMTDNVDNPNYHFSDEENFFDFRERCIKALEYLENLDKENVLVVTHALIMTMLTAIMVFGKEVTPENYATFGPFLRLSNTGITIYEFKEDRWTLVSWNDHSHL